MYFYRVEENEIDAEQRLANWSEFLKDDDNNDNETADNETAATETSTVIATQVSPEV